VRGTRNVHTTCEHLSVEVARILWTKKLRFMLVFGLIVTFRVARVNSKLAAHLLAGDTFRRTSFGRRRQVGFGRMLSHRASFSAAGVAVCFVQSMPSRT
jgi:hypothetical protein